MNEPDIYTENDASLDLYSTVAHGKLYVLNQRGEYEKVEILARWVGNSLLMVCSLGYEYNEDGEITRRWREGGVE